MIPYRAKPKFEVMRGAIRTLCFIGISKSLVQRRTSCFLRTHTQLWRDILQENK